MRHLLDARIGQKKMRASISTSHARRLSEVWDLRSSFYGSLFFSAAAAISTATGSRRKGPRLFPDHDARIGTGKQDNNPDDDLLKSHANPNNFPPWYVINAAIHARP